MDWLNYNHLFYFWMVAREGSIVRACEKLFVSQPTISAQIKALERYLKEPLFNRVGRRLVLTDAGRTAFQFADDMFLRGQELMDTIKQRPTDRVLRLTVGVADSLPKLVIQRVLMPALKLKQPVRLIVHEYGIDRLLIDLATYKLDVVLSDSSVGREVSVRTFSHPLGESGVTFFAARELASRLTRKFPQSLDGAPMFLPTSDTALRRSLDQWFDMHGVHPKVLGEFADSSLLKAFGRAGRGVFPSPSIVEADVHRVYGVNVVGRADGVIERVYAITVERKIKHPGVIAIIEAARSELFGNGKRDRSNT